MEPPTEPPVAAPSGPIVVYRDGLAEGVEFQPFPGALETAVQQDVVELPGAEPKRVLRVDLAGGRFTQLLGGTFRSERPYDLSGVDVLDIRMRASEPTEAHLGFGDEGLSVIAPSWLTGDWVTIRIPLPVPALLVDQELIFSVFVEMGREEDTTLWIESIVYVSTDEAVSRPRPVSDVAKEYDRFEGQSIDLPGQTFGYEIDGTMLELYCESGYLAFVVSDEDVALVSGQQLCLTGDGTTRVTATLGDIEARVTLEVRSFALPENPPTAPELPESDVLPLFSEEYAPGFLVARFLGGRSVDDDIGVIRDVTVDGNTLKLFSGMDKSWHEEPHATFSDTPVDAAQYRSVRFDMWVPGPASQSIAHNPEVRLGLGEGLMTSALPTVVLSAGNNLQYNAWTTYEVPIADFTTSPPAIGATLNGEEALGAIVFRNLGIAAFALDNLMFVR